MLSRTLLIWVPCSYHREGQGEVLFFSDRVDGAWSYFRENVLVEYSSLNIVRIEP